MITCKFIGKLGNQMYQTAATIQVAEQLNIEFVLPTTSHAGHYGNIKPDMSGFDYDFKFQNVSLPNKFQQPSFGYTPITVQDNMELHGFFQSHQYFDDIRHKLINKYFKFNDNVLKNSLKYDLDCNNNSLGVSVRRGDYLMLQHNHCVLSYQFYQIAFDCFPSVDKIYIFSDDYSWCKSTFGTDAIYVEEEKFTQLYMMTQMKNLIMSNSTFAWWGAYLNDKKGKIIIPDPWFGPNNFHHDTSGLYCPTWIRLKHTIVLS